MSSLSNVRLPQPKDWQDFERKARELFAFVLGDPKTAMNGRGGQPQHGVDIWGYRNNDLTRLVGVQCKLSSDDITELELRAELEKANTFTPTIAEFILVTTAPRDAKIQSVARELTEHLSKTARPIHVQVWGWEDIEEQAAKSQDIWNIFDPTYNPFAERAHKELSLQIASVQQDIQSLRLAAPLQAGSASTIQSVATDENTPRHGKITACQSLIEDGHAKTASAQLTKIRDAEWSSATRSERYRLLATMGSAQLRLGKQVEAGQLLLAAYSECPEYPKAELNRAKGFLLTGDDSRSAECARNLLNKDEKNADAAGTLIQALISKDGCNDPLKEIPQALHEKVEVLISYVHFLRCRGNDKWVGAATKAVELFPENALLKQFAAEAILESTIATNPGAIAGAPFEDPQAFEAALETLYRAAHDAIEKDYALIPPLAHNAALALRFVDDSHRAKEVLDAAIAQSPEDEGLRVQRALVAYAENDPAAALAALPEKPIGLEATGLLADAYAATGKADAALRLLDSVDESQLPEPIKVGFAAARIRAHFELGEPKEALELAKRHVKAEPSSVSFRALHVRVVRRVEGADAAKKILPSALAAVSEATPLSARMELASEAQRLDLYDSVFQLLHGRIATDRENPGLQMLFAAVINGNMPAAAKELLHSIDPKLHDTDWYLRAAAVLAINTGHASAEATVRRYLDLQPADLDMTLARITLLQRADRDSDIKRLLERLDLRSFSGAPKQLMRLAALVIHYDEPLKGLEFGYGTLLKNWQDAEAHLAYQGLLLLNKKPSEFISEPDEIRANCIVGLVAEGGQQRRYRIEDQQYEAFGEESLPPNHDLARLLLGKKVGDSITPHEHLGARPLKIDWVKSKYIDALHRSLDEFNERFPRSKELLKFTVDTQAADPLAEMRDVTKARAEASLRLLDQYRSQTLPLAFVGAMLGLDPIEALSGLHSVDYDFRVCRGTAPEREQSLKLLQKMEPRGCLVDAITLSIIRRLKVEAAIRAVCGPIFTTESVIQLLAFRVAEAEHSRESRQGFLAWENGQLAYAEYSKQQLEQTYLDRKAELDWAKENLQIAPAIPTTDLSPEQRGLVALFPRHVTDPALAAEGTKNLLLSDDMGFRAWAAQALHVPSTWSQPILMIARDRDLLSARDYSEAVNMLALSGHVHVSLDANSLLHQARKDNFDLTRTLSQLLKTVGGPKADLVSNSNVVSQFIDACWEDRPATLKVLRIASEAFSKMVCGRPEDQRAVVSLIVQKLSQKPQLMRDHALNWLIGHSIGLPYFGELLAAQKAS